MALKSPCTGVGRFDGRTGFCTACLRTLDEARSWKKITDHKRQQIIKDRPRRASKIAGAAGTADNG